MKTIEAIKSLKFGPASHFLARGGKGPVSGAPQQRSKEAEECVVQKTRFLTEAAVRRRSRLHQTSDELKAPKDGERILLRRGYPGMMVPGLAQVAGSTPAKGGGSLSLPVGSWENGGEEPLLIQKGAVAGVHRFDLKAVLQRVIRFGHHGMKTRW